jgi:hypothetical protein
MRAAMLDWMKRRGSMAHNQPEADGEPPKRQGSVMSGKYLALYKYLVNRYANTVVLTFAEIEDLLGFTLPDLARLHQEWWTNADPNADRPSYSDSWILASRTARPNLLAQTVVFERAS